MSTAGGGAANVSPTSGSSQTVQTCWSCRLTSGGGLVLTGWYVFDAARKALRHGGPTSVGTVAQITFAGCLASWGLVILLDPVGKMMRKKKA